MKPSVKQRAKNLLNSANLRKTQPRILVLKALINANRPLTAEQITSDITTNIPNKVTIYRILESFLSASLIHKVFLNQRAWHFELADNCTENQCHPHFTCTSCDKTHCLTEISIPMAKSPHKGFLINHQSTQLKGLCPQCNPSM